MGFIALGADLRSYFGAINPNERFHLSSLMSHPVIKQLMYERKGRFPPSPFLPALGNKAACSLNLIISSTWAGLSTSWRNHPHGGEGSRSPQFTARKAFSKDYNLQEKEECPGETFELVVIDGGTHGTVIRAIHFASRKIQLETPFSIQPHVAPWV